MLSFRLITPTVIEVKETVMSFTRDKVSYFYHDFQTFKGADSAKPVDDPAQLSWHNDSLSSVVWTEKYHLSKVGAKPVYNPSITEGKPEGYGSNHHSCLDIIGWPGSKRVSRPRAYAHVPAVKRAA